jgi:hypothetical protein
MPEGLKGTILDFDHRFTPGEPSPKQVEFLYYREVENSVEPVYEESPVRGRSEEHLFYSHTGADQYNFTIQLVASVDQNDGGDSKKPYRDYLLIKSFAYPDYGINLRGPVRPPRRVQLTIGTWFGKIGVIKAPSGTFQKPYDSDGFPFIVEVRFTFRVVNTKPLDMFGIRGGL